MRRTARFLLALGLAYHAAASPQYFPSSSPGDHDYDSNSDYSPPFFPDPDPDPTSTSTPSAPSCTTPAATALLLSEQPLFAYLQPQALLASFRTACPRYSAPIPAPVPVPIDACPYLCLMPPADSPFGKKYALVPEAYSFCAPAPSSPLPGAPVVGLTYTYDAGTGSAVTRPCVKCPPPLPLPVPVPVAPVSPVPEAVLVLAGNQMLRMDCGTRVSRRPGTCKFLCGLTEFEIARGKFPRGIGRCSDEAFFDPKKGGFFKKNFFPGLPSVVTECRRCEDDCGVGDLPGTPLDNTLDGLGVPV